MRGSPRKRVERLTFASRSRGDAVQLIFTYGSEKEAWIKDVTAAFNDAGSKIASGKRIEVEAIPVEAQFDLAIEDATLKGRPAAISANIGLVSHLLDDALFDGGSMTTTTEAGTREIEN